MSKLLSVFLLPMLVSGLTIVRKDDQDAEILDNHNNNVEGLAKLFLAHSAGETSSASMISAESRLAALLATPGAAEEAERALPALAKAMQEFFQKEAEDQGEDPRESADLISHLEKIVPMTPIDDGDDEDEDLGRGGARQKRSPRGRSRGGYGRRRRRGNGGAALLAGLALGALALGGLGLLAAATTTTGTAATLGTTAVLVPTGK